MPELVFDNDGFIDIDGYDGTKLGFAERRSADRILRNGLAAGLGDSWRVPDSSDRARFDHAADVGFDLPQAAVARFDIGPPRRHRALPFLARVAAAVIVLLAILLGGAYLSVRHTDEAGLQGLIWPRSTAESSLERSDGIKTPRVAVVGEPVSLVVAGIDDGVASITWFVAAADGLELGEDGGEEVGTGAALEHVFDLPGRHQVRAVVVTGDLSATRDAVITVVPAAAVRIEASGAEVGGGRLEWPVGETLTLVATGLDESVGPWAYRWSLDPSPAVAGPALDGRVVSGVVFDEAGTVEVRLEVAPADADLARVDGLRASDELTIVVG